MTHRSLLGEEKMLVMAISCHRFLWFFAARADNANYGNDYQQGDTPSYRAYYDNHCKIKENISCWIQNCSHQHLFERIFCTFNIIYKKFHIYLTNVFLVVFGPEKWKSNQTYHNGEWLMLKKDKERRLLQNNYSIQICTKTYVVGIRSQVWSELHT